MSLTVCQDYNNGHCLLFDEECFSQCLLKPKRNTPRCYEVVRLVKGLSDVYELVVNKDSGLTKAEAIKMAADLNYKCRLENSEYKYIWRMRA